MKNTWNWKRRIVKRLAMLVAAMATIPLWADLSRDASTTRIIGEEGEWVMENAVEYEKDNDGTTWTIETGIEFAPVDRVQLLLEPTLWERENPKDGPTVSGIGDTELTVAYLVLPDEGPWPGLVVSGKVKIPTADNRDIGTGKADYSISVIVGKEYGELDVALELEFGTYGSPAREREELEPMGDTAGEDEEEDGDEDGDAGAMDVPEPISSERLIDQFLYTLSADYGLTENLSVFVEFFGNTKPTRDEKASNDAKIGFEFDVELTDYANPFVTVEFDTDSVFAAKTGVEWNW